MALGDKPKPAPKTVYPFGMPLFTRERNIEYVAAQMREHAENVWARRNADGDLVDVDPDVLAEEFIRYADMIETLMSHGTRGYYVLGCRCTWCGEANRQSERRRTGGKPRFQFTKSILEDAL